LVKRGPFLPLVKQAEEVINRREFSAEAAEPAREAEEREDQRRRVQ
jgi:hypothetical protein